MPGKVTVACKMPNGVVLRMHRKEERPEPVMGGGMRMVEMWVATGDNVTIAGVAAEAGKLPNAPTSSGFALTPGVDADFWAAWLAQNKDLDMVRNGLIFAYDKPDFVVGKAKEMVKARTGMEPIDPNNLPRMGQFKIEKAVAA